MIGLFIDILNPDTEPLNVPEYQAYIKGLIDEYVRSGTPPSKGRPPTPVRPSAGALFLEKAAKNPGKYIAYSDPESLAPFIENIDQGGLEPDELRLANGKVLVFPGIVSMDPNGPVVVKKEG